jgi:hypothetical protein
LRYLLNVRWPATFDPSAADWERRAQQGAAFHQLVHQHTLGIPVDLLSKRAQEGALAQWWQAYLNAPPPGLPKALRQSELRLSTSLGRYRLAARYDLLAIQPGEKAVIVDWKTSSKRPLRAWLAARWQTLVYPYVLLEAGAHLNGGGTLAPEQIELIYWFAEFPGQVERFPYDGERHAAEGEALAHVIAEIEAREQETWSLTEDLRRCRYCTYPTLCERKVLEAETDEAEPELEVEPFDFDLDLEQIAEIEF